MLNAARQAFEELFSPPFRAVMVKCVAFTLALLAGLIALAVWSFSYFVVWPDWIETTIQWLGGLALVAGSIFLIPPVTSLIAGLYLDDIAGVVERQNFPGDPPGRELPTARSIWLAIRFFFVVLIVNLIALLLLLVPGVNLIAFYVGNGYLLGREYFELAAMRHVSEREAKRIRKANGTPILLCGLVIAALASVPILNLVTPLFATGFMVRVWKHIAAKPNARLPGAGERNGARDPFAQTTRV
ncbi:sulfate transporter family protein [Methyloceanibacter methanicus]|uniref:sulfate transporter family protein n=1 Tax=Methyloceanibacter methanicus TaxID=1774968 RepID=UPI000849B78A|nr:sulfate transporter family protein [Methyloceanibacter methanicus]